MIVTFLCMIYKKMGQDTVHKDCPQDPGKWNRLWLYKDIHNVLIKNSVRDHL